LWTFIIIIIIVIITNCIFFLHLYRASWYYQILLFINECTGDYLKNSTKIYIKIAPTCFGAVTPSSGSVLFVLAKVTLCYNSQLWFICVWLRQWRCDCIYWSRPCWGVYVALFGTYTPQQEDYLYMQPNHH